MGANDWSNDPFELDIESTWKGSDSPGAQMATTYGLKNPRPFLCNTRASGEANVVFEAQGKFYIWNQIQDEVWSVEDPTAEEGIVKQVKDDVNGLKLVAVEAVEGS